MVNLHRNVEGVKFKEEDRKEILPSTHPDCGIPQC